MVDVGMEDVKIHTPTVYPMFRKWAREFDFEGEVLSHNEFIKQLKHMQYYTDYRSVRMGSGDEVKKCRILKVDMLKEMEIIE